MTLYRFERIGLQLQAERGFNDQPAFVQVQGLLTIFVKLLDDILGLLSDLGQEVISRAF